VERHRLSRCGGEASTLCGGEGCSLLYIKLIDGRYVLIMTSATPGVPYEVFLPRDSMLRAVPHPIYSHLTTLLTGRVFSPRRVHAPHETPRFPRCTAFPNVYSTLLTGRHAPRRACNCRTRPHPSPRNAACGTFVFFLMVIDIFQDRFIPSCSTALIPQSIYTVLVTTTQNNTNTTQHLHNTTTPQHND
jgi:hypothetical protein